MAAPLIAIPALVSALITALGVCAKWIIEHTHIVKIVIVCGLLITAFESGLKAYTWLFQHFQNFLTSLGSFPAGGGGNLSLLAKVNYCIPLSEMLSLLAVYITFASMCLSFKGVLCLYRAIPFKSA